MISVGGLFGSGYTQANSESPAAMASVAVAPLNQCSCRPETAFERCACAPDCGLGSAEIQSQPSPPLDSGVAPRGKAPSTHATTAPSAAELVAANARRPSGHSTSAST